MSWNDLLSVIGIFVDLNKVVWVPSPKDIATITAIVYVLKRLLSLPFFKGLFDKLTSGVGTLVLVFITSFLTELLPKLDGGLTLGEALLLIGLSFGGSVGFWELLKRIFPFLKRS